MTEKANRQTKRNSDNLDTNSPLRHVKVLAGLLPVLLLTVAIITSAISFGWASAQNSNNIVNSNSSSTGGNQTSGKTIITTAGNQTTITTPSGAQVSNTGANNTSNLTSSSASSSSQPSGGAQQSTPTITTYSSSSPGGVRQSQFNMTGFASLANLIVNGKMYPVKYNITNGKLLGLVVDKDKTALVAVLGSQADNGKLTIEIPRNVVDAKGQGNTDTKFVVRIDEKGVDYKEIATSKNARVLQINFGKDDRVVEFTGTSAAS